MTTISMLRLGLVSTAVIGWLILYTCADMDDYNAVRQLMDENYTDLHDARLVLLKVGSRYSSVLSQAVKLVVFSLNHHRGTLLVAYASRCHAAVQLQWERSLVVIVFCDTTRALVLPKVSSGYCSALLLVVLLLVVLLLVVADR
jgi:hypothetical protein